ncbi:hypothetical protein BXP70_07795 [Hymenobacter crusticola]|uniref:Uncharacterized protein n=2 Tax=Hymenobacter crusticola TaxID=1770526 RepID=A0A243WI21_9BACT|nr:hypothetical protein BXP70_07795 [Hymenobacter crusticola]
MSTSHNVAVHVTGENLLPKLGANLQIYATQRRDGVVTSTLIAQKNYTGSIDTTYTLGTLAGMNALHTDAVSVRTLFLGCGAGGYIPPADSKLTASIIVDGKTTMSVTLDQSQKGTYVTNDLFLTGSILQELHKL